MSAPKIIAIIQARMGSTRLPGKTLANISGKPLLQLMIERIKRSSLLSKTIVATSTNKENDAIEMLCRKLGIECFRGSENDVLSRFIAIAKKESADHYARICGDQPFIDASIIDRAIQSHINSGADYTSTALKRTFPSGVDVELISRTALSKLAALPTTDYEREHVTARIYKGKEFTINNVAAQRNLRKPALNLLVDTARDLRYARKLYEALGDLNAPIDKVVEITQSKKIRRQPLVAFRADGSVQKGLGHLISCFRLARELQRASDAEIIFISQNHPEGINAIKNHGHQVIALMPNRSHRAEASPNEARRIVDILRELRPDVYYTDLLHISNNYAPALRALGIKTVSNDVLGTTHFSPDVIINRSALPRRLSGYRNKKGQAFNGPEYAILDEHFARAHAQNRTIAPTARNILLTFGGSDHLNLTCKTLRALERMGADISVTAVIGRAYPHRRALNALLPRLHRKITVVEDTPDMAKLMLSADLAIASSGQTLYELACTGTPAIALISELGQIGNIPDFAGAVLPLGRGNRIPAGTLARAAGKLINDRQMRAAMSAQGKKLVDGKGLARVAAIVTRLLG